MSNRVDLLRERHYDFKAGPSARVCQKTGLALRPAVSWLPSPTPSANMGYCVQAGAHERYMASASDHYDSHLGRIYSWMVGDVEAARARSAAELEAVGLPVKPHGTALDLGAGIGLHALPLARLGFSVTAIDSCQQLLDELRARSGSLPIATVTADIVEFPELVKRPADAILCMGDTLTHLPDVSSVELLFA